MVPSVFFVRQSVSWLRRDERIARFIEQSELNRIKLLDLARVADMGISDIVVEYVDDSRAAEEIEMLPVMMVEQLEHRLAQDGDEHRENLTTELDAIRARTLFLRSRSRRPRLLLTHGSVRFELRDESDGTQLWPDLLPQVITSLGNGRTLVIGKIDTSLHPLLVRKLVGLFRDPAVNESRAQLLFTTHDAYVLAPVAGSTR
jgi:hypothetical protein